MLSRRFLFFIFLSITVVVGCKKDAVKPKVTIIGKWLLTKHTLQLFRAGSQLSIQSKTDYTGHDYIQYFEDGTGVLSAEASPAPSLSTFKYLLTGTSLKQFTANDTKGVLETVTKLTETEFAIHYETNIADPYNPNLTDNEVDDFEFIKGL